VQLLFLQKHRTDGRFTVVCGSFGQVKLDAASKQALDALKTRVGQFREWCQKITDEALRKAMDGYYQAALDFVAKPS
jgi:hypothetical protein